MTKYKGKIVAHHRVFIPHPTEKGLYEPPEGTKLPIRLDVSAGLFHAVVPKFIADAIDDLNVAEDFPLRQTYTETPVVTSSDLNTLKGHLKTLLREFEEWRDANQARKVLAVFFACNSLKPEFGSVHQTVLRGEKFRDVSFVAAPTLHLSYQVAWQIGSNLFDRRNGAFYSLNTRQSPDFFLDWTSEREETLSNAVQSLERLIGMIANFVAEGRKNPDAAVALLAKNGPALLPAPHPREDQADET